MEVYHNRLVGNFSLLFPEVLAHLQISVQMCCVFPGYQIKCPQSLGHHHLFLEYPTDLASGAEE